MSIKAIIFDYGEVLNAAIDRTATLAHRTKLGERLGLPADDVWPYLFTGEPARLWMTGKLDWDAFWPMVLAPRGISDPQEVDDFAVEAFSVADAQGLNPDVVALIRELQDQYKLAVLSNASWTEAELTERLYEELGMPTGVFDTVITSRSVGAIKPDPRIYRAALERLEVEPHEAVFTDDLSAFTEAAAEMGLHAHTFTTAARFRAFLEELDVL
ncbi:MAG: HAD family phosphatase [Candidatus Promineifilaceae bacterium]|nr:HAD family phosphatase [Candidatus Promineifilaceae bacterium]